MIATDAPARFLLRFLAPLIWRNDLKVAAKLEGFASTEAGSALDMLKAAELTEDPRLRKLFFRHAMDEARHAQQFRDCARQLAVDSRQAASEYNLIHATRQNLLEQLGLVRFVAFVYLAERRGELQFRALQEHFRDRPQLQSLFARIGKDEQFHVAYSHQLLEGWRAQGQGPQVRRAIRSIQLNRALDAWKRSGHIWGDLLTRLLLSVVYFAVLPVFTIVARLSDPAKPGWKKRPALEATLEAAQRQY